MDNKDILKEIFGGSQSEVNIIPVMNMETGSHDIKDEELPRLLPILPLRNAILFPNTVIPVTVGRPKSIQLINDVFRSGRLLGAVTQLDAKTEDPTPSDIYRTARWDASSRPLRCPTIPLLLSSRVSGVSIYARSTLRRPT